MNTIKIWFAVTRRMKSVGLNRMSVNALSQQADSESIKNAKHQRVTGFTRCQRRKA